jgi:hypothetical protein
MPFAIECLCDGKETSTFLKWSLTPVLRLLFVMYTMELSS